MASVQTIMLRPPRSKRGQGAVEAILALPVFLLLVSILFQLFFLALAQVQLRYAAFCAARVGAVRNADIKEMEAAAGKVLCLTPALIPVSEGSYRVEILDLASKKDRKTESGEMLHTELLKVRVHWDYPLSVPFLDILWTGSKSQKLLQRKGTVLLHASWTTIKFAETPEITDDEVQPHS